MTAAAMKADPEKSPYDLKLEKVCKTIQENRYKTVLLQFPEGLKNQAMKVKDIVEEKTDAAIYISADLCYGACDIPLGVHQVDIDLIVQFGHADIPNVEYPCKVIFIEACSKLEVMPVVKSSTSHLKGKVGIITTIQHIHWLDEVKQYLTEKGFKALIGKGSDRVLYNGQVLGCDLSSATSISSEVDCYLFIGSGNFHAIGVAMATKKPVIIADPYLNEVRETEEIKDRLLRQRHGAITKAQKAKTIGIIVGTKPGQIRQRMAFDLQKLARKHEKKGYVLLMNEIAFINLSAFKIDAYVSTACPRIAIDDYLKFQAPVLTPQEFKIALGELDWEDYTFDEIL
ncbi:MAG: diphthamide biosynthesis enzyme Dph2 [Methanomassiliicoccales archaeon]|nr:MAG: diphthamide biosynthesis enzyme Dph2 [Methanomassiliicoccales archaeon]